MAKESGRWQPPRKQPVVLVIKGRGISQRQLAIAISYSDTYVSLVHRGRVKASPRYRAAVAQYLALPESLLFHEATSGDVAPARADVWTTAPQLTAVRSEDLPRRRGSYLEPAR